MSTDKSMISNAFGERRRMAEQLGVTQKPSVKGRSFFAITEGVKAKYNVLPADHRLTGCEFEIDARGNTIQ